MKTMTIFDPAMCCSTGVCGPSVDENLLRVSTTINRLAKQNIVVERHNLSQDPKAYIDNTVVNKLLNDQGVDVLPITIVDGEVVKTGEYPTDHEFISFLEIPKEYILSEPKGEKNSKDCCGGNDCC